MDEEVKEILKYLQDDKNYNCDCNDGSYYLEIPYMEAHIIADNIINLQSKINKARNRLLTDISLIKSIPDMSHQEILQRLENIDYILRNK